MRLGSSSDSVSLYLPRGAQHPACACYRGWAGTHMGVGLGRHVDGHLLSCFLPRSHAICIGPLFAGAKSANCRAAVSSRNLESENGLHSTPVTHPGVGPLFPQFQSRREDSEEADHVDLGRASEKRRKGLELGGHMYHGVEYQIPHCPAIAVSAAVPIEARQSHT
jgi:hypothetical protein